MLALALGFLLDASPPPVPSVTTGGGGGTSFTDIVPLVTGAGGALVVLLLVVYAFYSDKIISVGAVTRLREADNNRFNDMVAQRDDLVKALELANSTSATAVDNSKQSLALLRDAVALAKEH